MCVCTGLELRELMQKRMGRNSVGSKSGEERGGMGKAGSREGGGAKGWPLFPIGLPYIWQWYILLLVYWA